MQTFLWFVVIMCLTLLYGMRMRHVVGYVQSQLVHWYVAVTLVFGLVIGAVLVTQYDIVVPRDVAVALHGILMFIGAWLGLRYWFSWTFWDGPAMALAAVLVGFYFIDPAAYNNIMFGVVTLGCAVGGYYMSKWTLKILCAGMAVFDVYAVWGSNLMDRLMEQQPGPFPSQLLVGSFFPQHFSIGVLDALLAGLVIVGIIHHRSLVRATLFVAYYVGAVFCIGLLAEPLAMHSITVFTQVPLLVVLAPLAWYFLRAKRHQEPLS